MRCGIEPLEEVAMNVGGVRVHVNDDLERAMSDNDRDGLFEVELRFWGFCASNAS